MSVEETQHAEGVPELEAQPEGSFQEEGLPSDTEQFTMPEKFKGKSAEEIARSYAELEKFKGNGDVAEDEPEAVEEAPKPNVYLEEFKTTGELSQASYEALIAQGATRETIDEALDYEKYKQDKATREMADVVGGIENYSAMEQWTVEQFSPEDRQAFVNEFAQAGTLGRKALLKDMYSQFTAHTTGGDVIHTNTPQGTGAKGYTSQHELQKDMADKRYGNDRSYTKAVEMKLAKSNLDRIE